MREVILTRNEGGVDNQARGPELPFAQERLQDDMIVASGSQIVAERRADDLQTGFDPDSLQKS